MFIWIFWIKKKIINIKCSLLNKTLHFLMTEIFSIKLWRKPTKLYPMTIISVFFSSGSGFGSKEPKTPGSDLLRLPSPAIYLYIYTSIHLYIYASMHLYIYTSIYLYIYLFIYLFIHLSIYPFILLSIYAFILLSI